MISVEIKNARLKIALAIPAGAPIIEILPVVTDKTMTCQNIQKKLHIC